MTGIADRLNAAADRLEAHQVLVDAEVQPLLKSGHYDTCDVMLLDRSCTCPFRLARLIAALRPLAPLIVKQLRDAVDRLREECEIELDYAPFHRDGYCGRDVDPDQRGGCKHWDHDLALADAILGAAS